MHVIKSSNRNYKKDIKKARKQTQELKGGSHKLHLTLLNSVLAVIRVAAVIKIMQLLWNVYTYYRNVGPTRNLERSCLFRARLKVLGLAIVTSLSGSEFHALTMRVVKKCFWMVFLASGRVSLKEWPRKLWVVESVRKFSGVIVMWWWIILWQVSKSTMRRRCSRDFNFKIFSRSL